MDQRLNIIFSADGTQLNKTISQVESRLGKFQQTTTQSTAAMINLGRVIQDAPYGFIGIANNLNPLVESFQRLKQTTGSTGSALKALGSSLLGPGGLGLAISVLSSALIVFGSNMFGAGKKTKEAKEEMSEAEKAQKSFSEAIDKAASSVVNQSNKLSDLRGELISTTTEVNNLTAATINQGVAQFIFDKKNVELQKILNAEIQKGIKEREKANIAARIPEFNPQIISKDPLEKQIGEAKASLGILNNLGVGLENFFKKLVDKSPGKEIAAKIKEDIRLLEPVKIPAELDISFKLNREDAVKKIFSDKELSGLFNQKKIISGIVPGASEDVAKRNQAFFDTYQKNIRNTAELVSSTLTPAFDEFTDAIFRNENPIKAFFNGLVESINRVIKKLIAAAVQAAILSAISGGATSFGSAFKSILGFGGIASPTRFGGSGGLSINVSGQLFGRGTDLVAVVTQGQTSIRRVGG